MLSRFVRRQTIWWPTWWGWAGIFLFGASLLGLWVWKAEDFLVATYREPAEVLVVEGWISLEGIRKAAEEFKARGYKIAVTTGGLSGRSWSEERYNYADIARTELIRAGIPPEAIIAAAPSSTESQRTYAMAVAAWQMLEKRGVHPTAINVFTRGTHARRSRLVYSKVFRSPIQVGVVSWRPPGEEADIPWWYSSPRTEELVKESAAFLFEALLDSGRAATPPMSAQAKSSEVRKS